jgi:hypothetical protein
MTENSSVEDRLRRTLKAIGEQPIPPAPLTFDPGGGSAQHHPVRIVSVALVLVVVVGGLTLALVYGPHSGVGGESKPVPTPVTSTRYPANFVLINSGDLEIDSAKTGQLVKNLGPIAGYTNNGLALSPDGQYVYLTVIKSRSIAIERIRVDSGQETPFADGEQPSISPNGRFVAYGAAPTTSSKNLIVRDLTSGTTRSMNLQKLLGGQTDLLNASIKWLGNGSQIVVLPGPVLNTLMPDTTTTTPSPGSCSVTSISQTCLIVVNVPVGHPLTARRVMLNGLRSTNFVTGPSGRSGLLIAAGSGTSRAVVYKVDVSSSSSTFNRLFSLPPVLPEAFDSRGTELFYLKGHGPVALWLGDVTRHGLENARRLNADVSLGSLAW